jgi:hypothetical protein
VSGPLHVYVDWDRNGNFTGPFDDVTDDVRGTVSVSFGRESVTALAPLIAGRGSFDLDNTSRRYSPRNASSPLFGKVKPARPVLITRDVKVATTTTTYTIFRGHIDDTPISPDVDGRLVTVNLVDSLQDFQQNTISTELWQGLRSGDAIGKILDAAGWTGGRDLDPGCSIFPWWWAEGSTAASALQDVLDSEGPPSLLTIGPAGEIVFRDRCHRLTRSASTTSQRTLRGTDSAPEPVIGRGFTYSDNWQNIINDVVLQVDERAASALDVVWSSDETITIPASSSVNVLVRTSDPFYGAVLPVGTFGSFITNLDFTTISGSPQASSLSRLSGAALTITLTATGGVPAALSNLRLRALSVPVARSYQVTSTDATSQTDYGQRNVPGTASPAWVSRWDATDLAQQATAQRAQPLPALQVPFTCHDSQATRLDAVLALDLSDRVTVIEPETGLANDFFVETISHEIGSVAQHVITLGLEMVPTTPTSVFMLGTSTLNSATPLAY